MTMQPLEARVKNGKLVLDDPATDLAEGSEVELLLVDPELDAEERARLLQAIEDGAGRTRLMSWRRRSERPG
jgi:hypothetical protein